MVSLSPKVENLNFTLKEINFEVTLNTDTYSTGYFKKKLKSDFPFMVKYEKYSVPLLNNVCKNLGFHDFHSFSTEGDLIPWGHSFLFVEKDNKLSQ